MKNINLSFEFIFSMIEDIQDLAKFTNDQNFSLEEAYFNIREFLKEVSLLFEEQCKFKKLKLIKKVAQDMPLMIYAD